MPRAPILHKHALALLCALCLNSPAMANEAEALYRAGLEAAADFRHGHAMMEFRRAAAQGHREAMCNLGLMLLLEEPRSEARRKEALDLLQQAAERNSEVARFVLARLGVYQPKR